MIGHHAWPITMRLKSDRKWSVTIAHLPEGAWSRELKTSDAEKACSEEMKTGDAEGAWSRETEDGWCKDSVQHELKRGDAKKFEGGECKEMCYPKTAFLSRSGVGKLIPVARSHLTCCRSQEPQWDPRLCMLPTKTTFFSRSGVGKLIPVAGKLKTGDAEGAWSRETEDRSCSAGGEMKTGDAEEAWSRKTTGQFTFLIYL